MNDEEVAGYIREVRKLVREHPEVIEEKISEFLKLNREGYKHMDKDSSDRGFFGLQAIGIELRIMLERRPRLVKPAHNDSQPSEEDDA